MKSSPLKLEPEIALFFRGGLCLGGLCLGRLVLNVEYEKKEWVIAYWKEKPSGDFEKEKEKR